MKSITILLAGLLFAHNAGADTALPKIASLNACTDELLLAAAAPEQIAGLSRYPIRGVEKISKNEEQIRSLSGGAEEVLAIDPDLILAGAFTRRESLEMLKKFGYRIEYFDIPDDFEDIESDIRRVAKLAGREEKAEMLSRSLRREIGRPSQTENEGKRPRAVFYGIAGHVTGSGTFEDAILKAAGARNAAAEAGIRGHHWITLEELIALEPDAVFLMEDPGSPNSAGQLALRHPALKKALPGTILKAIPPGLLNCGSPDSAQAVNLIRDALKAGKQ